MRLHWLRLRATAHPTEDLSKVQAAVRHLSGLDEEGFASLTEVVPIESHHGATLHVVETTLRRAREVRGCLARLVPDPPVLAEELEARTDDDGVFYLRFDKQAALQGEVVPTRGEDAVQVRLKPEVHPAGRDRSMAALRAWMAS